MQQVTSQNHHLLEQISDLNFQLETVSDRYRYYQASYETQKEEMMRLESDFRQSRSQQMQKSAESQRAANQTRQENDQLRMKCQDLELKLES